MTTRFTRTIGCRCAGFSAARLRRAFSLIEILAVVTLLAVIILGLVAMFHQTQRALMSTTTQVDVLESGRAAADLLSRQLAQMTPSYWSDPNAHNFYVTNNNLPTYFTQAMVDPTEQRTNVLQEFFFVTRSNQQWSAMGYWVSNSARGVGTLYCNDYGPALIGLPSKIYGVVNVSQIASAWNHFWVSTRPGHYNEQPGILPSSVSRVVDGVVHLRVRAYDTNGVLIANNHGNYVAQYDLGSDYDNDYVYRFWSNAVPAYVTLELGVLENRTYERWKAIQNQAAADNYLSNHAGQVHIFRQRIPIRNVDPSAYQ